MPRDPDIGTDQECFVCDGSGVIAAHEAKAEPFGYFRAEPFGWTDCAADDEGAIALYERPAAPAVPQGWTIRHIDGGISVTHKDGSGAFVRETENSERIIPAEILYRLCSDLIAVAPQPEPAVPQSLQPIETIKYWADAYSDRSSGPHFQGHGMVVTMLREYEQLRTILAATPAAPSQPVTDAWADGVQCAADLLKRMAVELVTERGEIDPDTGAVQFMSNATREWHASLCELAEEIERLKPATPAAPSQGPVNRPQNCGTSFCSCIECVCEPEPVTLTDEEIKRNWSGGACPPWGIKFARAIIAALREKEQAT